MRYRLANLFGKISLLCIFSFAVLASCTTVHADRIKIYSAYTLPASDVSSDQVGSKTLEIRRSVGDYINLSQIGFPLAQYSSLPEERYGFRTKSGDLYILKYETSSQSDKQGWVFQVEQSGVYYNTADPLPLSNANLYPVYEKHTSSSQDDPSSSTSSQDKVGVRLDFFYNEVDDSGNYVLVPKSVEHLYTDSEKASGDVNLARYGFYPEGDVGWKPFDLKEDQNRLVYGYMNPDNYNESYFFDKTPLELSNEKDYQFIGDDGKIYSPNTILDVTRYTVVKPMYVPAGYRPVKDSFGEYTTSSSSGGKHDLYLDMVFVPGTYNKPWPFELAHITNGEFCITRPNYNVRDSGPWSDALTKPGQFPTQDMLVSEILITRDFLYNLTRHMTNIAVIDPANPYKVNTSNPNDETDKCSFIFNTLSTANPLSTESNGGLINYTTPGIFANKMTYPDYFVMANMLTRIYNICNPDNKLSYAYYADVNFTTPITDATQCNDKVCSDGFYTDKSATGYRLPSSVEFSYLSRVITDERMLPSGSSIPDGYATPLVLFKSVSGLDRNYMTARDSEYTGDFNWCGGASGLALYDPQKGVYDGSIMRNAYQYIIKGQSNWNASGSVSNYDYSIPQRKGYDRYNVVGDNLQEVNWDGNQRDGCGTFFMKHAIRLESPAFPTASKTGFQAAAAGFNGNNGEVAVTSGIRHAYRAWSDVKGNDGIYVTGATVGLRLLRYV